MDDSLMGAIGPTDAQAEAVKAVADTTGLAITESSRLLRCLRKILGDVPENFVEVFVGSHLRFLRFKNAVYYDDRIAAITARRNAETQPVSPSVAKPLLEAAFEESRPELQELWAELIAAAMDKDRAGRVRYRFIETVKQLDPLDALLLRQLKSAQGNVQPNAKSYWAQMLSRGFDEIEISVENLTRLGCAYTHSANPQLLILTGFGREMLRVCED